MARIGGFFPNIGKFLFGTKRQTFAGIGESELTVFQGNDDNRTWVKAGSRKIDRSLSQAKQDLVCNRAYKLWSENPFAHRIIQIGVNFIIGDGLKVEAKHDKVQKILDTFREANKLDQRDQEIVRDLLLLGEMFILAPANQITGDVSLGYIDPIEVKSVLVNPRNYNQSLYVVINTDAAADPVKFQIVNKNFETGFLEGEIFFWFINKPISASRGLSDIYAVLDWCEGTEDLLWTLLDKAELQTRHVMEIVHEGATQQELEHIMEKEKGKPPPKSGSVFHSNKPNSINYVTPQLGAGELDTVTDKFFSVIYAASGIPKHWFGTGEDVNRASAVEMGTPTHRWLSGRQKEYLNYMTELHQFVIDQKRRYTEELAGLSEEDLEFEIVAPEIATKDAAQMANTLKAKIEAIISAKMAGHISDEQAQDLVSEAFRDAGMELSETESVEAIENVQGGK